MGRIKQFALTLVALSSAPASAGTSSSGQINYIASSHYSIAMRTTGTRSGAPACATDPTWTVTSVTGTTGSNDVLIATILAWYLAGRSFTVYGTGTCDGNGTRETISYVEISS